MGRVPFPRIRMLQHRTSLIKSTHVGSSLFPPSVDLQILTNMTPMHHNMTPMHHMHHSTRTVLLTLLTVILSLGLLPGCDSGGSAVDDQLRLDDVDADAILQQEGEAVILGTYTDLESQAATLEQRVKELEANPTQENLEAAQAAWVAARTPWESSESFLFGPVGDQDLDPALDSWPVDESAINAELESGGSPNTDRVRSFDFTKRGFHTVEYFLFGPPLEDTDGVRSAANLTDREFEYMVSAAVVLHDDATALVAAWSPEGDDYLSRFTSGDLFQSGKKGALEQLLNGIEIIAGEVAVGKIGTPLNEGTIQKIESKYSRNSFRDFRNNLVSIRRIYTGDVNGSSGPGLDEIVKQARPEVHQTMMEQIDTAISQLESLNESTSFREAIETGNTQLVVDAQNAVDDILQTAENDIAPIISNL